MINLHIHGHCRGNVEHPPDFRSPDIVGVKICSKSAAVTYYTIRLLNEKLSMNATWPAKRLRPKIDI